MPPQQSNRSSQTGRDAAMLGRLAMDDAVAAARPDASIAAAGGTLSEQNAAGAAAASTRHIWRWLERHWSAFQKRRRRRSLRAALHELSDRELMDIGVRREQIDCISRRRAIDTLGDSTAHLWVLSRGVM